MFKAQLERIKLKLNQARSVDSDLKVFGASSHKYELSPPASLTEVEQFEQKHQFSFPLCYREFLLSLGNGGAGPFYGLYPLGYCLDDLAEKVGDTLGKPSVVHPGITRDAWNKLTHRLQNDEDITDDEFDREIANVYAGIMPLGTQGCDSIHALVVTGQHAGRVINAEIGCDWEPKFCYEDNFLDWYERWLDEVISGILISDQATWFGYTMGGDDLTLLKYFEESVDDDEKVEALVGLAKLHSIHDSSCDQLKYIYTNGCEEIRHLAAGLLAKFSYEKSKRVLKELIAGDEVDYRIACQAIFWYQKGHCTEWVPHILERMPTVCEPETFRFLMYVLREAEFDYGALLVPFYKSESEIIRSISYYSLSLLERKADYLDEFIQGLNDPSPRVVHATLQALAGVKSAKLIAEYLGIISRFQTDEYYILTNLDNRLKELGFETRAAFVGKHGKGTSQTGDN